MAGFDPIPAQARAGIAQLGLDRVLDSLTAATAEFVASEKAFRNTARKNLISGVLTDIETQAEGAHNDLGLQHLDRALIEIGNMNNLDPDHKSQVDNALGSAEGRQALANGRTGFAERLAAQDLAPAEMQEILSSWDAAAGQVTSFDNMVTALQQRTARVRELRSQPNRGRESASPLAWWKAELIDAIGVVSLGAIIACFIWFGCSWLLWYLSWAAPWLYDLINWGC